MIGERTCETCCLEKAVSSACEACKPSYKNWHPKGSEQLSIGEELSCLRAQNERLKAKNKNLRYLLSPEYVENYGDLCLVMTGDVKKHVFGLREERDRLTAELVQLREKFQNRGHLMDAYIRALSEISDGKENPVDFARNIFLQGSKVLVEAEKQKKKEEEARKG